jgi:hypothetical protein
MRAERTTPATDSQPTPPPHTISPHAVYSIAAAQVALGLARETLPREIRLGRLQARQRGGRYLILGQWLLDWISTGRAHRNWKGGERQPCLNGSAAR